MYKLKPYMGYSQSGGSSEGAILIFAHTAKEAKAIGYGCIMGYFTDEYTDVAVNLIRNGDYLLKQAEPDKLKRDIPHYIFDPVICKVCKLWGTGELNDRGICPNCIEEEKIYIHNAGIKGESK